MRATEMSVYGKILQYAVQSNGIIYYLFIFENSFIYWWKTFDKLISRVTLQLDEAQCMAQTAQHKQHIHAQIQ